MESPPMICRLIFHPSLTFGRPPRIRGKRSRWIVQPTMGLRISLERRMHDGDALGVHADGGADVGDASRRDLSPRAAGVAGHGGVGDRQNATEVVAGEEEAAAESVGAGVVAEDGV